MIEVSSASARESAERRDREEHARLLAKRVRVRRLLRLVAVAVVPTAALGVLNLAAGNDREGVWLMMIAAGLGVEYASTYTELRPAFEARRWRLAGVGHLSSKIIVAVAVAYYFIK